MNNRAYSTEKGKRLPPDLTDEQKKDITEGFRVLDMDGSNTITPNDLKVALRALGYEPEKDMIRRLVAEMDRGGVSNNLVLSEFMEIMRQKFFGEDVEEELQLAFPLFTEGKSDYITLEDLKRVAQEVGEDIPEESLREMIESADVLDRDRRISYDEFLKMLMPKSKGGNNHSGIPHSPRGEPPTSGNDSGQRRIR